MPLSRKDTSDTYPYCVSKMKCCNNVKKHLDGPATSLVIQLYFWDLTGSLDNPDMDT
jgi:hypothetical protein